MSVSTFLTVEQLLDYPMVIVSFHAHIILNSEESPNKHRGSRRQGAVLILTTANMPSLGLPSTV